MRIALLSLLAFAAAVTVACGSESPTGDGRTAVVATTTQVADFARNVGGERVDVHQILQPNSDPHEYEPRPSDARAIAGAALVLRSGGDVDEWMDDVIDGAGGDARQITLMDHVRVRVGGHVHEHEDGQEGAHDEDGHDEDGHDEGSGHDHAEDEADPHWWQDPRNAQRAVRAIRDGLIAADPGGRATYQRNAARYLRRIAALDRATAACIGKLPVSQRKLVTTHDALGYYADRYGLELVGAVIPSLSTQAQPSAKDVQQLVDQIRGTGVEAIYPESSISPKLEEAVARESGARTGSPLWADSLGPRGSSGATYVDSIAANTAAIVEGSSGGAVRCRPPV